jgi:hypothetical protein
MNPVKSRIVIHFPGFEPLDAAAHRGRFERAANQTAEIWNIAVDCDELKPVEGGGVFDVKAAGPGWEMHTGFHIFDLAEHIAQLQARPLLKVLASGYGAFAKVIAHRGTWNYMRHAWRFGLFAIFPFLLMGIGPGMAIFVALLPFLINLNVWNVAWSVPLALIIFNYAFMPLVNRTHTMLLFSDWKCAVDFAILGDQKLDTRLEEMVRGVRLALSQTADEYLITSHSIGGNCAVHVIGQLLEREPELFAGKTIVFASLGSGILQCALLRPAKILRKRVGLIAASPNIFWFDVQCLTDVSHFYKTKVAQLCGHNGQRQPVVSFIRVKTMLTHERYIRIKRDLLRVHRQYVLGNDVRANYDFAFMCAGPLPAETFAALGVGTMPPIAEDGAVLNVVRLIP